MKSMILIPAILSSFASLKDKTLKVVFETNEPTPEQIIGIASSTGQFGYLAFKVDTFKKQEIEALESLEADYEDTGKTPGQRLRGVLYVNFTNNAEGFDTFTRYYDYQMEKIITHYKSKLP